MIKNNLVRMAGLVTLLGATVLLARYSAQRPRYFSPDKTVQSSDSQQIPVNSAPQNSRITLPENWVVYEDTITRDQLEIMQKRNTEDCGVRVLSANIPGTDWVKAYFAGGQFRSSARQAMLGQPAVGITDDELQTRLREYSSTEQKSNPANLIVLAKIGKNVYIMGPEGQRIRANENWERMYAGVTDYKN